MISICITFRIVLETKVFFAGYKTELLKSLDINLDTPLTRGPFSLLWRRINPNVTPSYEPLFET